MKFAKTLAVTLLLFSMPATGFDAGMIPAIQKVTVWADKVASVGLPWGNAQEWEGKEANGTPCFLQIENRDFFHADGHKDIIVDYVEGSHFKFWSNGYTYTVEGDDTNLHPALEYYLDSKGQPDPAGTDSDLILDVQSKSNAFSVRAKGLQDAEVIVALDANGNPQSATGIDHTMKISKTCVLSGIGHIVHFIQGRLVSTGKVIPRLAAGQFELLTNGSEVYDLIVNGPMRAIVFQNGQLNRNIGALVQLYGEVEPNQDGTASHRPFLVMIPPGGSLGDFIKVIDSSSN